MFILRKLPSYIFKKTDIHRNTLIEKRSCLNNIKSGFNYKCIIQNSNDDWEISLSLNQVEYIYGTYSALDHIYFAINYNKILILRIDNEYNYQTISSYFHKKCIINNSLIVKLPVVYNYNFRII